jgi:hypothetical protein
MTKNGTTRLDAERNAEVARRRLEAQGVSATAFERPAEAVGWLGAVQAQDYLGALWAVGLRLAPATEADVERSLADGSVVRTWPLRGTLHFVRAVDARWMLELLAPRVIAGAAGRFRALGLDDATFARARRALVKRLEKEGPVTRAAAYEALERARISTAGQRGIHVLWRLAHDRVLCFGPRRGKQQTFVLFEAWVAGAKALARDEALAELAGRYFASHGPATLADFAWWSGLTVADARAAVDAAGRRLSRDTFGDRVHWFGAAAATAVAPRSRAHLLPSFDEFLVGYADRSAAVDEEHRRRVNSGGGILRPTIVVDARVVGTWRRTLTRGAVAFEPSPFAPLGAAEARSVRAATRRYADFLGLEVRGDP